MVTVEFTLTQAEFQFAQRQMMARSLLVAGLSGLMVALIVAGAATGRWSAVVIGIFWFVLIACMFVFAPGSAWRRNPAVRAEQQHAFEKGGINLSFGGRRTEVDWAYFTQFVVGKSVYQLLRGKKFGLVVPRRAFRSPADEKAFTEMVHLNVPARRGRPGWRRPAAGPEVRSPE